MNSARIAASSRKRPENHVVTVAAEGFSTPRIAMHICLQVDGAVFEARPTLSSGTPLSRAIDEHCDARGLAELLDRLPDLRRQPFLDLKTLGEEPDEACKLGEAYD